MAKGYRQKKLVIVRLFCKYGFFFLSLEDNFERLANHVVNYIVKFNVHIFLKTSAI